LSILPLHVRRNDEKNIKASGTRSSTHSNPPGSLSEKDRLGIGTFQPKDEKNQDSTELTGDINYRKIAEYGSDSIRERSILTANLTSPTAA
jgi:hypothetical protein